MLRKDPYREFLEKDFNKLFEMLELREPQRQYLRSRWLDQVLWMESRAGKSRDRYYKLRLTSIIGGVIVPILVGLNVNDQRIANVLRNVTIGLSTVVAVSAAVEEFFHYGERWRHYRRSVETLKTQGWQFSQLTGLYASYGTHSEAFQIFAAQVEDIIQKDVELYATQVAQANSKKEDGPDSSSSSRPYIVAEPPSIPLSATPTSINTSPVLPLPASETTSSESGSPSLR